MVPKIATVFSAHLRFRFTVHTAVAISATAHKTAKSQSGMNTSPCWFRSPHREPIQKPKLTRNTYHRNDQGHRNRRRANHQKRPLPRQTRLWNLPKRVRLGLISFTHVTPSKNEYYVPVPISRSRFCTESAGRHRLPPVAPRYENKSVTDFGRSFQ